MPEHRAIAAPAHLGALLPGLLVVVVASRLLAAEPERRAVRLIFQRSGEADRCPTREHIEQQVRSRLGYDPFSASAQTSVKAALSGAPGRWKARVEMLDARGRVAGERSLDSPASDCDELAASVAFAISIAIDPLSGSRPTPAASSAAPPASSSAPAASAPAASALPSVPASSAPPAPERAPAASSPPAAPVAPVPGRAGGAARPSLQASLGGFVISGAAPSLTGGLALGAGARWSPASLSIEGRLQAPSSLEVSPGQVTVSVLSLSLVPCAHAGVLLACAVGALGSMHGEGSGVKNPRSSRSPVVDVGGRFGIEASLVAPLSLRAFGEVQAHLSSVTLELNGQNVWRSPSFGGGGGLSLVASFW